MQKQVRKIPDCLFTDELRQAYLDSNLDWNYYLEHIKILESAKRENFPPDTIKAWFIEMMRRHWDRNTFGKRFSAVMSATKYGTISFDVWVQAKEVYSFDEITAHANRIVNQRLRKAEQLLEKGSELSPKDKKIIELTVKENAARVIYEQRRKKAEEYMDEQVKELLTELNITLGGHGTTNRME